MKVWTSLLEVACLTSACKKDVPLDECVSTEERLFTPPFTVPMVLPVGDANDSLDVDGDTVADLRFSTARSYADLPGAHSEYFDYWIGVQGLGSTRVVAHEPLSYEGGPCDAALDCGDLVKPDAPALEQGALAMTSWMNFACNDFSTGGFFGFVLNTNGEQRCGYAYAIASEMVGVQVLRVVIAECDGLPLRIEQ